MKGSTVLQGRNGKLQIDYDHRNYTTPNPKDRKVQKINTHSRDITLRDSLVTMSHLGNHLS